MEKEDLMFIINRLDLNIGNTNSKAALLLAIETFLLGCIISESNTIFAIYSTDTLLIKILIFSFINLCISITLTLYSIKPIINSSLIRFPFVKEKSKESINRSNIFFSDIAKLEKEDYVKSINSRSYNIKKDMEYQIVELSKIARIKYKLLSWALITLIYGFVLSWLVIIILKLV